MLNAKRLLVVFCFAAVALLAVAGLGFSDEAAPGAAPMTNSSSVAPAPAAGQPAPAPSGY